VENLWLLAVCFALGALARRSGRFAPDSHRVLNAWVLNVSLPALVVKVVHVVSFSPRLVLAAALIWAELGLAVMVALWAVRRGWASRGVAGALALTAGLGNTAFVGLPLLEGLGGASAVAPAAVIDQLGSFVAFSAIAVPFAAVMGGTQVRLTAVLGRVVRFAPFIALVVALASRPFVFPPALDGVLGKLADTMSPLALASVGWQLEGKAIRGNLRLLAVGLGYKLVLAPALVLAVLWATQPSFGLVERVAVAQAGMAPMVTAGVLALDAGLESRLASAMIAVGVPLSLVSVWSWWLFTLGFFG
jgi:hypothetical protein